jgi:hypothetical protein
MLPLPHRWPIRCARCGHKGEISAAVSDLTSKMLRCAACGHRQAFEPSNVVRSSRQANGWRSTRRARTVPTGTTRSVRPATDDLPVDRLDDLWAAG